MEAEVHIRPLTAADDAQMAALVQSNLKAHGLDIPGTAYFDPELAHLSRFYGERPDRRRYFVAVDDTGTVLGGAGLAEFERFADCAEMQKLYLADGAKGKGLGTRFVQMVEDSARALGYRFLYLETHTNLTAACRMYEKLGFSPIERPAGAQHGTMNRFYLKTL